MTEKRGRISVKMPFKDSDFLSFGVTNPELDRFLESYEDWATGVFVQEKHKYHLDTDIFWRMAKENDSPINARGKYAVRLLDSAWHLRSFLEENKAEQAAISMLELIGCAIGIYMEERKGSSSNGGKSSKKKEGMKLAIEEALEKSKAKTSAGLWRYFKTNHSGEDNAFQTGNYDVWYYEDPPGSGNGFLYQALYHNGGQKKSEIVFATFKKYVREVKKYLTNHSTQTEEIL